MLLLQGLCKEKPIFKKEVSIVRFSRPFCFILWRPRGISTETHGGWGGYLAYHVFMKPSPCVQRCGKHRELEVISKPQSGSLDTNPGSVRSVEQDEISRATFMPVEGASPSDSGWQLPEPCSCTILRVRVVTKLACLTKRLPASFPSCLPSSQASNRHGQQFFFFFF